MFGNCVEVECIIVQFGVFSLNGGIEDDIDGDCEEFEICFQFFQDFFVV